jgi:hypothetical protein
MGPVAAPLPPPPLPDEAAGVPVLTGDPEPAGDPELAGGSEVAGAPEPPTALVGALCGGAALLDAACGSLRFARTWTEWLAWVRRRLELDVRACPPRRAARGLPMPPSGGPNPSSRPADFTNLPVRPDEIVGLAAWSDRAWLNPNTTSAAHAIPTAPTRIRGTPGVGRPRRRRERVPATGGLASARPEATSGLCAHRRQRRIEVGGLRRRRTAGGSSSRWTTSGGGPCSTSCISAECSPQKSEALGGDTGRSVGGDPGPSITDDWGTSSRWSAPASGSPFSPAPAPIGTSSSRGPSQSRGKCTTLLVGWDPLLPFSLCGPSVSTRLPLPAATITSCERGSIAH